MPCRLFRILRCGATSVIVVLVTENGDGSAGTAHAPPIAPKRHCFCGAQGETPSAPPRLVLFGLEIGKHGYGQQEEFRFICICPRIESD